MTDKGKSEQIDDKAMLACIFRGVGNIEPVRMVVPTAAAGEVVVKVSRVGICGSDLKVYKYGGDIKPGTVPGHEFSGIITAVGAGVTGLAAGDRVTVNPMKSLIGIYRDGAFAEYVKVPEARVGHSVHRLPDTITAAQGAMIEPLAVALRGVKHCQLTADTRVVVQGLGTIGLCALLILKQRGVNKVIGVDRPGVRLEMAKSLGAIPHRLGEDDLNGTLQEVFGVTPGTSREAGVDLVIDATGNESALKESVRLLRLGGQLLVLGSYANDVSVDLNSIVARELKLFGSIAYQEEFAEALELIASGMDVAALISHQFPLAEIQAALDTALNPSAAIKVLLSAE